MNRSAGSHHTRLAVNPSIAAQSPSKLFNFSTGVIIKKSGGIVKGVCITPSWQTGCSLENAGTAFIKGCLAELASLRQYLSSLSCVRIFCGHLAMSARTGSDTWRWFLEVRFRGRGLIHGVGFWRVVLLFGQAEKNLPLRGFAGLSGRDCLLV